MLEFILLCLPCSRHMCLNQEHRLQRMPMRLQFFCLVLLERSFYAKKRLTNFLSVFVARTKISKHKYKVTKNLNLYFIFCCVCFNLFFSLFYFFTKMNKKKKLCKFILRNNFNSLFIYFHKYLYKACNPNISN